MSGELRQMLHRDGERKIVTSEAEKAAALAEGWGLHRTPPLVVETPVLSERPPILTMPDEPLITAMDELDAAIVETPKKKRGRPKLAHK